MLSVCALVFVALGTTAVTGTLSASPHGSSAAAATGSHPPTTSTVPQPGGTAATTVPTTAATTGGPLAVAATTGGPLGVAATTYLAGRDDTVIAAVTDLSTGQTWSIGSDKPQATASVVKVDILEALLAGEPDGGLPTATDQSLANAMIEQSTDTAAQTLFTQIGGPGALARFNNSAGLSHTTPTWVWGLTTTVPQDQIGLLQTLISANTLLDTAQRQYVLGLMEHVTPGQAWGVSGGVPGTVTIALKNGWVPLTTQGGVWQVNSIGWIDGQGRDYLIAVMTAGNSTFAYGRTTIDGLSAIVWQALAPSAG